MQLARIYYDFNTSKDAIAGIAKIRCAILIYRKYSLVIVTVIRVENIGVANMSAGNQNV